ncbi:uncharacterized protein [Battus philenor]|uniref:uncharacterized protein n=1 Tax=Battus philenor TaxID=42288 RepID=UPI0035D12F05
MSVRVQLRGMSACAGSANGGAVAGAAGAAGAAAEGAGAGVQFARQRTWARARPGGSAALRCRVLRLGDRAVSWVRSSDLQILTHAGTVFTADARVSAITGQAADDELPDGEPEDPWDEQPDDQPHEQPEEQPYEQPDEPPDEQYRQGGGGGQSVEQRADETVHTLHIERLRTSDAGRYECQINTEPKMSLFFELSVTDSRPPEVELRALGARALSGAVGGSASLACEARYLSTSDPHSSLPPLRIRWYHGGQPLNAQSPPSGVSLSAERWTGGARSRLTLGALRRRHAGAWRCAAAGSSVAFALSVTARPAHAPDGEAMQRDQAAAQASCAPARRAHPALPALPALAALALWARTLPPA